MWSNAVLIAGVGFSVVFIVLTVLMAAMHIAGLALSSKKHHESEHTK